MVHKVYVTYNEVLLCRTTPPPTCCKTPPLPARPRLSAPRYTRDQGRSKTTQGPVHVSGGRLANDGTVS
jgi:hypothetical protein